MAVYNGADYLVPAIDSILQQTYSHFEFIIINDGSTDDTTKILQHYEQLDERIKVYAQANQGLPISLNRGIRLARGKYIARMDADDISLPERFAKQVEFMESHPEVGVCGTQIKMIGENSYVDAYPSSHPAIQCWLLLASGIAHPSVFLRYSFIELYQLYYDPEYTYCQDYELWIRASNYCKLANIPEVLLFYRSHPEQMGQSYSENVRSLEYRFVWTKLCGCLQLQATEERWYVHRLLWKFSFLQTRQFITQVEAWLVALLSANQHQHVYSESELERFISDRWFIICDNTRSLGIWMAWKFRFSNLTHMSSLTRKEIREFCVDCIKRDIKKLLFYCGLRKSV
ncbi:glycosyltransferase [bacterium]|nr:glycosyltransferase [bacterium]